MIPPILFTAGNFYVTKEALKGRAVFRVYENGVTAAALRATFDLPPPMALGRAIERCEQLAKKETKP